MMEWFLTSSVLILVLALLRRMLRGRIGLRFQYALWAVVLLRLLIPWSPVESGISVLNVTKEPEVQAIVDSVREPIRWESQIVEVDQESGETLPVTATHFIANEEDLYHFYSPAEVSFVIWKWGCVLLFGFMLTSNLVFLRKLERNRARKKVPGVTIPVYTSPVVQTPCLAGFLHPSIYLPEQNWEQTQLWYVIEHELTHYSHKDHLISVLRCVALALHWYNPLVWWAAKASKEDGELACDEGTLARLGEGERIPYGQTLLELTCTSGRNNFMLTATTMTGSKRSLKERIQRIAKKPQMAAVTLIAVIAAMALAVGCTFTGVREENGVQEQNSGSNEPYFHGFRPLVDQTEESIEILKMLEEIFDCTKSSEENTIRLHHDGQGYLLDVEEAHLDFLLGYMNRYIWEEIQVAENPDSTGNVMSLTLRDSQGENLAVHITAWEDIYEMVEIIWVPLSETESEIVRYFIASPRDESTWPTMFATLYDVFKQQELSIQAEERGDGGTGKHEFLVTIEEIVGENEHASISYANGLVPILRFDLSPDDLDGLLELLNQYKWAVEIKEFPYYEDDPHIDIWFEDGTLLSFGSYYTGILKNEDNKWSVWYSMPKKDGADWTYTSMASFLENVFFEKYDPMESDEIAELLYDEILAMESQAVLSSRDKEVGPQELDELHSRFCAELIHAYHWVETVSPMNLPRNHFERYVLEGNGCTIRYYGDPEVVEYTRGEEVHYFCPVQSDFEFSYTLGGRVARVYHDISQGYGGISFEDVTVQQAAEQVVQMLPQLLESFYGEKTGLKAENVVILSSQLSIDDHDDTIIGCDVQLSLPQKSYEGMELEDAKVEQEEDRVILDLEFYLEGANKTFWVFDIMYLERNQLILP